MAQSQITGDLYVSGSVSANSLTPSDGSVTNAKIVAGAAIDADKVETIHRRETDFGVQWDAAPGADAEVVVGPLKAAGVLRSYQAVLGDTGTSTDVKFDLKRAAAGSNSFSTMLSATIDFTNADTDATAKSGTLSATALAAGDRLQMVMDYTSATGAQGPGAVVEWDESPS